MNPPINHKMSEKKQIGQDFISGQGLSAVCPVGPHIVWPETFLGQEGVPEEKELAKRQNQKQKPLRTETKEHVQTQVTPTPI